MNELIKPVVKWVGGKRQLLPEINKRLPKEFTTYYEPFLGGGAVLFDIIPKTAIVNDYNEELINMYKVIKNDAEGLLSLLEKHKELNSSDYFYEVRAWDRDPEYETNLSNLQKAARLIYLNKTCFNGLYRVNSSGFFNTPYGKYKNPNIINGESILALHNYFNNANIIFKTGDFEDAIKYNQNDAFVYFDPPYAPLSPTSNYTGYTAAGFGKEDQIRLRQLCDKLDNHGVKFLLSNSNVEFIQNQYKDYIIDVIGAKRSINSNGKKRGKVEEVLIRNYEI